MIVRRAESSPSSSAWSIRERATRSLIEPVGLRPSSLTNTRTPVRGERLLTSTRGVLPMEALASKDGRRAPLPMTLIRWSPHVPRTRSVVVV